MVTFNIKQFTWDKENNVLIQEASSLNLQTVPEKITIKNPKTRRFIVFKLDKTMRSNEQEILSWRYASTYPAIFNGTLEIIND